MYAYVYARRDSRIYMFYLFFIAVCCHLQYYPASSYLISVKSPNDTASVLTFEEGISRAIVGVYRCVVKNSVGSASNIYYVNATEG